MTLTQLRFAAAVARTRSFSGAATACHVSQPSLSAAVAKLEAELGGPLFARTTRRVDVTALGAALLPLVSGVLDGVHHLAAAAEAARAPGRRIVRLGLSPLVSTPVLARMLDGFTRQRADVAVVLKQCFLDDLRDRLDRDGLDVAAVPAGFGGRSFDRCAFYADPLHYLPAEAGADAGGASGPIALKAIAGDTFVLSADGCGLTPFVRALFRRHGHRLREYAGAALNHQVIEEWAALGLGAGLLPLRKLANDHRRTRPVVLRSGQPVLVRYELVWKARGGGGAHVTALIRHFRAHAVRAAVERERA
jgi:LysR family hydrogen peroxide-inducible transcriptional activator